MDGAPVHSTNNGQHPTSDPNLLIVRRIVDEVLNKGDLAVADELIVPDFVEHNPRPGQGPGLEGFKQRTRMLRTAFPDLHYIVQDELAADDRVAIRVTARGTHKGKLAGLAPTGKAFTMTGIVIFRIAGGKIVERWATYDNLGMLQQLGVAPVWDRLGARLRNLLPLRAPKKTVVWTAPSRPAWATNGSVTSGGRSS